MLPEEATLGNPFVRSFGLVQVSPLVLAMQNVHPASRSLRPRMGHFQFLFRSDF